MTTADVALGRRTERRPTPGVIVAATARLHSHSLDRDLAAGIAARRSPAHAERARQLTRPRTRRALAASLERLLAEVQLPLAQRRGAVIPPCRRSVLASAHQIHDLAARLRSDEPVSPAGVARLNALLRDGAGPVYVDGGRSRTLSAALTMAARWLDPED
jgi:hypothetical protein